ncbi:ATP-dependent RecD-like DNA helicase [Thermodesulfobacteriota bacterium]
MITLDGNLERITYYNEENHYTIAKLNTGPTQHPVTVIGYMPAVSPGEALKIKGSWETHPTFGQQFRIVSFEVTLPASVNGIRNYLKSGIIKGIGPAMAERLVEHFQENTLDVIEKAPAKLLEVSGIGKVKAALIIDAWKNHHAIRGLMHFLQKHGIETSFSAKILKKYGINAENIICGDPYRLTVDIPGIDFHVADTIALNMGVAEDDPNRITACILYLMGLYASEGHTLAYAEQLVERCTKLLGVENGLVTEALKLLEDAGNVVVECLPADPDAVGVYSRTLYEAEVGISNRLKALLSIPVTSPGLDPEQITMEVLKKLAIKLSSEQLIVLEEILSHRVAIITGGPGTGKTTLIRSVTAIFESIGKKILLVAPTGRAARRLSEVTRRKASTIHKLLGYNLTTGGFDRNQDNPLETDALIIDETSMVDTLLMFHLLKALPMTSVLIMVGDIFQLPSVGPGNVLSDMIGSEKIRTFELKKIFRQAQESPIVNNAHKIRRGESPDLAETEHTQDLSEFYFIEQHNPDTVVNTVVELCTHRIPRRYNFDKVKEIQVLTPMHRGAVGTINLNKVLQKVLNPSIDSGGTKGIQFKPDDKVMHLKNNYQKEVFNGDIGTVISVNRGKKQLWVDYDGREVCYEFAELDELTLAYAISVHKSQGSEYPAVIVPIMTQHYALLQRNLLYTAITRGKKLVILIGTKKALGIALKNDKPRHRLTGLANRLTEN